MSETKINQGHDDNRKAHPLLDAVRQMGGRVHESGRRIELIPVARLTASKTNARTHSPRQIRQIAASIKRFGITAPVLVNAQNEILAGHGRVEAAKLLGLAEVPVLRLNHLSAVEQRAYAIADNRLAELAGWDRDALAIELEALIELDFAIEVTGFDMGEIDLILDDQDEDCNESPGGEAKLPKATSEPAISRCGDVWRLGDHQLVCGSSPDTLAYTAVDAAIRRWQNLTGTSATLAGSDRTFNATEKERRKRAAAPADSGRAVRPKGDPS